MSDQVEFNPYPRATEEPANAVLVIVNAKVTATTTIVSGRMPEGRALGVIAAIAMRRPQPLVDVADSDQIIVISEREVLLVGSSLWSGDYNTRVVVGTVV